MDRTFDFNGCPESEIDAAVAAMAARTFDTDSCFGKTTGEGNEAVADWPAIKLDCIFGSDISGLSFATDSCFGDTIGDGDEAVAGHASAAEGKAVPVIPYTKQTFSKQVASLGAFHKTHGHWPSRTDSEKLSNFCRAFRRARKCPEKEAFVKLNNERITILNDIGFDWNPQRRNGLAECLHAFGDVVLVGSDPPAEPVLPPGPADSPVRDYDVLCGRALGQLNHAGTHQFKELLEQNRQIYLEARKRDAKAALVRSAVLLVRRRGGRFLQKDSTGGPLREIGDTAAWDWTRKRLGRGARAAAGRKAAPVLAVHEGRAPPREEPPAKRNFQRFEATGGPPPLPVSPVDCKNDLRSEGGQDLMELRLESPFQMGDSPPATNAQAFCQAFSITTPNALFTGDAQDTQGSVLPDTRPLKRAKRDKRCQTTPVTPPSRPVRETVPWSAPKTEFAASLKDLISAAANHPSWWEDAAFAAAITTLKWGTPQQPRL